MWDHGVFLKEPFYRAAPVPFSVGEAGCSRSLYQAKLLKLKESTAAGAKWDFTSLRFSSPLPQPFSCFMSRSILSDTITIFSLYHTRPRHTLGFRYRFSAKLKRRVQHVNRTRVRKAFCISIEWCYATKKSFLLTLSHSRKYGSGCSK